MSVIPMKLLTPELEELEQKVTLKLCQKCFPAPKDCKAFFEEWGMKRALEKCAKAKYIGTTRAGKCTCIYRADGGELPQIDKEERDHG